MAPQNGHRLFLGQSDVQFQRNFDSPKRGWWLCSLPDKVQKSLCVLAYQDKVLVCFYWTFRSRLVFYLISTRTYSLAELRWFVIILILVSRSGISVGLDNILNQENFMALICKRIRGLAEYCSLCWFFLLSFFINVPQQLIVYASSFPFTISYISGQNFHIIACNIMSRPLNIRIWQGMFHTRILENKNKIKK